MFSKLISVGRTQTSNPQSFAVSVAALPLNDVLPKSLHKMKAQRNAPSGHCALFFSCAVAASTRKKIKRLVPQEKNTLSRREVFLVV